MKRIAILVSGRGSNAEALIRACQAGEIDGEVVLVTGDVPTAPALAKARDLGISTHATDPHDFASKVDYESHLLRMISESGADLICLAGYMRLVGPLLLGAYRRRILNIHPSLLPAFPGLDAQAQALRAGVKVAGCTVHFIDAGIDSGPIVAQTAVPVADDDTADSLAARILEAEHPTYVRAVAAYCRGDLRWQDGRVVGAGQEEL